MPDFSEDPMLSEIPIYPMPKTLQDLNELLEDFHQDSKVQAFQNAQDRNRPYNGQSWTDSGLRGKTFVEGLTMRDIADCFTLACYRASGLSSANYPASLYDLPWNDMDIIAIRQNLTCEIEKRMGIFPNVPD